MALVDLSYKNIISNFFVNDKLMAQRTERIENGFQFVLDNVPERELSQKLQDVIRNRVTSMEVTFFKKWRESRAKSVDEFEQQYDKWIQIHLKLPPSIMSQKKRRSTQKKKIFEELSGRQRNRRVEDLSSCDVSELLLAAVNSAKNSNEMDLHYVLKLLYTDREKASEIVSLLKADKSKIKSKDK